MHVLSLWGESVVNASTRKNSAVAVAEKRKLSQEIKEKHGRTSTEKLA